MRWTILIPVKVTHTAKSRLRGASASAAAHERLVRAIRSDTVAASAAAALVARVILVCDDAINWPGRTVFVQTRPGLNPALAEAAEHASRQWPGDGVAALVGDLPALSAAELDDVLGRAADVPAAFVPDSAGVGTTLLTAAPAVGLRPAFGDGSAARHRGYASELHAGPGLRHDVDTPDDLRAALTLGVGAHTRRALAPTGAARSGGYAAG